MTTARMIAVVQDALWLEAELLLLHHTNPWELDEACLQAGFSRGVCDVQDHIGLDAVLARFADRPPPILNRMVAEGRLGKQGGVGYYRYPGGGGAVVDPLIEDLIREEAWFAKITRCEIPNAALVGRLQAAVAATLSGSCLSRRDRDALAGSIFAPAGFLPP